MTITAILGAASIGASIYGASKTAAAAKSAAKAQTKAADKATETQLQMYETTRGDLAPYRGVGEGAVYSLADLYGLPTPANPEGGQPFPQSALDAFERSPDYRFAFDQGVKATDASAASKGMLLSGAQLKALTQFGQGLATQTFNNYVGRLSGLAGMGGSAAAATGNAALSTGKGVANTQLAAGEARAAGIVGANNAWATGLEDAFNNLGALPSLNTGSAYTVPWRNPDTGAVSYLQ